jgi:2-dehydro-3-deoxyphosphogluconate aldolase / (4S)-4-hydroxy-2-oxoglutarate aldolase
MSKAFDDSCKLVAEGLSKAKVVPVLAVDDVDSGVRLCGILRDAGLNCAEITFRTSAAVGIISAVSKLYPDMFLGAGTVLNTIDLNRAIDSGAKFAVAPGCNPKVVAAAVDAGFPFLPGIANPSDIECALELGCKLLKFFPAEPLGGLKLLKALIAPYKHLGVKFMPTGGITLDNMKSYFEVKEILAVGGTWLAKPEDLKSGNWDVISKVALETSAKLKA